MQCIFDNDRKGLDQYTVAEINDRCIKFNHDIQLSINGFLAPVVGNYYAYKAAQKHYESLRVGDEVIFKFEPTNKFDVNAIAVYSEDGKLMLGHTDRGSAKKLAESINAIFADFDLNHLAKSKIAMVGTVTGSASANGRVLVKASEINKID